jgi:hypothetical protein
VPAINERLSNSLRRATPLQGASLYLRGMGRALGRLGWLLDFAERTITPSMSKDELTSLQDQVLAFCLAHAGPHFQSSDVRKFTIKDLADLQTHLRQGVNWLSKNTLQNWYLPKVQRRIIKDPQTGSGRLVLWGSPQTVFVHFAAELITAEGMRIERCARPRCNRLFVRRKRGRYCSKRCSQYARTKRYREKRAKSEIERARASQARRQAYEQRVKARLGENIKVGRNRRRGPKRR